MTDKQIKEIEILYQGLNWHIGVDGCYINNTEKEPIFNHLYEVALACKSKSEQLKRKEQECDRLRETTNQAIIEQEKLVVEVNKKSEECERLEGRLKKIAEFRHNYCMNCEDLLKPSHSCKGCNMVALKQVIEGEENERI